MQLAILHHHLNRGGVTSVIANHLRSLATLSEGERPERVVVLFDGQRDGWPKRLVEQLAHAFPIELIVEPALAYDTPDVKADPVALAVALAERLAGCGLSPTKDLLHTHNHSLGKTAALPGALGRLAAEGWRMLLQIHDFAEDNRPDNYRHLRRALAEPDPDLLGAILYPQGAHVHYATLTLRDADVLRAAGFADNKVHVLANPIAEFGKLPSQQEAKSRVFPKLDLPIDARLIVYPVRGIRRKNLGEMLLLSALAPEGTYFAVTLRPKNPIEAESFDRWKQLAEELDLPCRFDTEEAYGVDYYDILAACDSLLTTSIAEGFGMVFLEAWLTGKPLIGRDLPDITREFKALEMTFSRLSDELRVDTWGLLEKSERTALHVDRVYRKVCHAYEVDPLRFEDSIDTLSEVINEKSADFARLTRGDQIATIRAAAAARVTNGAAGLDRMRELNPRLGEQLAAGSKASEPEITANRAIVQREYSVERVATRLRSAYHSVIAGGAATASEVSGAAILRHYTEPSAVIPARLEA